MTHQQLVQAWKERFDTQVHDAPHIKEAIWNFCNDFALAAAKGAAEAGKTEKENATFETKRSIARQKFCWAEARAWNAAISQSESQLEEYFKV